VSGFLGSLLWVAEGKYISECATEETKGFYFSYFWAFYMQSQIFGNLIAALILGEMDQVSYFVIMSVIAFAASASFAFLRKPYKKQTLHQSVDIGASNYASSVELPPSPRGDGDSLVGPRGTAENGERTKFKEDIKRVWEMTSSRRMRMFLPQLLWIGVSIAVYTGILVPMINLSLKDVANSNTRFEYSMFAMVAFGLGEIVGGLLIGQVVDRRGSKLASLVNMGLVAFTVLLTLFYLSYLRYNLLVFLMAFMWGVEDGAVNTHCLEMLGFEFDDNTVPFSIFSMFEAVAVFVFQILQSFVGDSYGWYIGLTGLSGALMCGTTYFFEFRERSS
jgi:MFS family permease